MSEVERMADYYSIRKELSEQLLNWWHGQTDFKTKKALADFLKVHPDTLGDYFSGRQFPRSDIANRLGELTKIVSLRLHTGADSLSEVGQRESSSIPLPPSPVVPSAEKLPESGVPVSTGSSTDELSLGKSPEAKPESRPQRDVTKRGERYAGKSVVISLQRTKCPFCARDISRFDTCAYCGQHFVWANVPIEQDELL